MSKKGFKYTTSQSRLRAACICLMATMPFVALTCVAQQQTQLYTAGGYGTYAFVGNVVQVARTAPVAIGPGCGTPQVGATASGTVASVNAFPVLTTGVIDTTATSALNVATGTSDIHQINALGGLVVADEIKSVSTTSKDSNGNLHVSAAGSNLVNMFIAGIPITSIPAPNTTINLVGFGRVVLNEQITSNLRGRAILTVNMVHIYVTVGNVLNIPVGVQVIVADAYSGLMELTGPASLDGLSYGTFLTSRLIQSSPTAPAGVGCNGNPLYTVTQVGINVQGILSSGTIQDTAQGTVNGTQSSSQTSSTIQAINLLAGIITVDAIQGQASASTNDGVNFNFNTAGSFVNIRVAGHPEITDNVAANTVVPLAGIGTLYLHRIVQTNNFVEVRMIELQIGNNTLNLPLGLNLRVCDSEASLHSLAKP